MSTSAICYLCERAVATILRSASLTNIPSVNIYEGISRSNLSSDEEETKSYPCVIVACQRADMPEDIGYNWAATVMVEVVSNADDTTADGHQVNCSEVFDALITNTIAEDMTAAVDGFTAFLVIPELQEWEVEERSWKSRYTFRVHCCGSNIS